MARRMTVLERGIAELLEVSRENSRVLAEHGVILAEHGVILRALLARDQVQH